MELLDNIASLRFFVPELVLAGLALLLILVDLVVRRRDGAVIGYLTLATLALVGWLTLSGDGADGTRLFYGMIVHDGLARFFKVFIASAAFLTVLVSIRSPELEPRFRGEYFVLLLFATFGMFLMVSASNLLIVYLSIEMASLSSYILAGFLSDDTRSSEASFKYVIYGAVASGVMLFGISLVFGMTGTVDIPAIGERLAIGSPYALVLALVFIFAGLGYKIASVPFHMWSPDVYEGAPIPITAFLSVASKAAGFGVTIRVFRDGLGAADVIAAMDWPFFLALISAITMTVGNLAAIGQRNVKRLLAYSSIAHGGYLLMGVAAMGSGAFQNAAVAAILFYFVVYLFMNLGAFYVVQHLAVPGRLGSEEIASYRGLVRRAPLVALLMSVFLFSLIGIPPFAGFWGKLYLFKVVVDASLAPGAVGGHNLVWLVVLGLLNSAISLYYYFSIVKAMLLDAPEEREPVRMNSAFALLLVLLFLPTLLFGLVTSVGAFRVDSAAEPTASVDLPGPTH